MAETGWLPSVPEKACSVVNFPAVLILKIVPRLWAPPNCADPYKFPSVPCTNGAEGPLPSVPPVNEYSVVKAPPDVTL
jgi:hypothetical protein